MRVLVTGATGFIGAQLARVLLGDGCRVTALIRPTSDLRRIADCAGALELLRCDLRSADELDTALERVRPEVCLHLAWYVEPGRYLHSEQNLAFLSASQHLASRLATLGCRRFVGVGTCFEYDCSLGYLSEESRVGPRSLYAAAKLSLQLTLQELGRVTGMEVAWARLFYQYGPTEAERRLIPSVICSMLRDEPVRVTLGDQVRDFLHVEDVAHALELLARSDLSGPVNVGSGRPVTVKEVVGRIGAMLGRSELIEWGAVSQDASEPPFVCANNRRLRTHTGWTPRFELDEGLRDTVDWWKRHLRVS